MFSIAICILTILVKMLAKEETCEEIGKVRKITINESDCFICSKEIKKSKLEEESAGVRIFKVTLYCDHSYHYNCITSWMEKNSKCPLCENSKDLGSVEKTEFRRTSFLERLPLKLSKISLRSNSFSD